MSLSHTHTYKRESVKIPIIRLAFSPSMLGAVIKSEAKFELVSQSDGLKPTNRHHSPLRTCVCVCACKLCECMCFLPLFHGQSGKKANSSMFFNRMWSRPKPETTTLSSQTATGLHDIKSTVFLQKQRQRQREEEKYSEGGFFERI